MEEMRVCLGRKGIKRSDMCGKGVFRVTGWCQGAVNGVMKEGGVWE